MKRFLKTIAAIVILVLAASFFALPAMAYNTGDDYPYKDKPMQGYDPYLFVYRNCTSFVAWCLNSRNGVEFNNWYGGVQWGWAGNWPNAANQLGIPVDNNPAVGSVACTSGHVAWVREVNGSTVTTDEYNWDEDGAYHTRTADKSHFNCFIHIKDLGPGGNQKPIGDFNYASGGVGSVYVYGWAKDLDEPSKSLTLEIYVGGPAGSNVPVYTLVANKPRSDVGGNYGFGDTIYVNVYGTKTIYLYARDTQDGNYNALIGTQTVTITQDTQPPVIRNVQISDVSSTGYTVSCEVTDNVAVDRVAFPTWTVPGGKDDQMSDWSHKALGTLENGRFTYRVKTADHGGQANCEYITNIYAYDKAGNLAFATQTDWPLTQKVPSPINNVYVDTYFNEGYYQVRFKVDKGWGASQTQVAAWSETNGQDDLVTKEAPYVFIEYVSSVKTADHNGEIGCYYNTRIIVRDGAGNSTSVGPEDFPALRVRVPAGLEAPEITAFAEDGNWIHLEWNPSPLLDSGDRRAYSVRGVMYPYAPQTIIENTQALSADFDLSQYYRPGYGMSVFVVAIDERTGDESPGAYQYFTFAGEFTPPESIVMTAGDTLTWRDWIVLMDPAGGIKMRMKDFEMLSSDPAVVEVVPVETPNMPGTKSLVAHKPGSVTLTMGFANQPRSLRTTQVIVLPSPDTPLPLPASLKVIEDEAFAGTGLVSIRVPDGCTSIDSRAFADSKTLQRLYIPATVKNIAFDAFEGCDNLTIYAPEGSTAIKMAKGLGIPFVAES